jgi:DNA processing protein
MSIIESNEITASYTHAFNLIPGIGPQKLFLLDRAFDSLADAWHADQDTLVRSGLSPALCETIDRTREQIDPIVEWQKLQESDVDLITHADDTFPKNLRSISHAPFALYVRGDTSILSHSSVAIVGSRKPSAYAGAATSHIGSDIAHEQIIVISGLALGIDALAHRAAMDASGKTIAVLAGGIDNATIAPRSHLSLAHQIITSGGALVSEYPNQTTPHRGTFPARNRIMAGLADATVIIEAAKNSGTLITAEHAHAFGRPLFALPGSIFSTNVFGPHTLIQNGMAQLLHASSDILTVFNKTTVANNDIAQPIFTDPLHAEIYDIIAQHNDGLQINMIIKRSDKETTIVSSALTMMEIDGTVINIGNQTYIAAHSKYTQ